MAKRQRGSNRPGPRRSSRRPAARPAERPSADLAAPTPPRPAGTLTPEEEARAAEIEARLLAEERAAEEARRRNRDRAREAGVGRRELVPLGVRAASEYAYVRRDVARITRIAVLLLGILAVLHVLINVTGTISI